MSGDARSFVPYEVPLRPGGGTARLVLPADLSPAEAERLCEVINSLAFPAPRPHTSREHPCPRCAAEGVVHCDRCNGSGRAVGDVAPCPDCKGAGNLGPAAPVKAGETQ